MTKFRSLEAEKEVEMTAIWGAKGGNNERYPIRRNRNKNQKLAAKRAMNDVENNNDTNESVIATSENDENNNDEDFVDECLNGENVKGSVITNQSTLDCITLDSNKGKSLHSKATEEPKLKKNLFENAYRLHCFVEAGTTINDIRTTFEGYDPKVELRTSQKGNLLNKTHYTVLTFRNKAMALHAVKMLDGTDQRNTLGVTKLKFNLMLNRAQSKLVRQRGKKKRNNIELKKHISNVNDEKAFIEQFIREHLHTHKERKHQKSMEEMEEALKPNVFDLFLVRNR